MIVISEGPIDDILLPPIIGTVAKQYDLNWPVEIEREISTQVKKEWDLVL